MKLPKDIRGAYLVTGPSGVGKTAVTRELQKLGFNVEYNESICHFVDSTGKEAPRPWEVSDLEWLSKHSWVFNKDILISELEAHKDDHVFIEAVAANMGSYRSHFKNIFYLKLDDKALTGRIKADSRADRYGKEDFQLREILDGVKNLESWVMKAHGSSIDAARPIGEVANDILAKT